MPNAELIRALNVAGQSVNFVGGFLLTVEAIRVGRVAMAADVLKTVADAMTSSLGKHKPLPLRPRFAISCAIIAVGIWLFAPALLLFSITPALFVVIYLVRQFMIWSTQLTADGYSGIVGFALVTIGAGLQLAATLM